MQAANRQPGPCGALISPGSARVFRKDRQACALASGYPAWALRVTRDMRPEEVGASPTVERHEPKPAGLHRRSPMPACTGAPCIEALWRPQSGH